jgi:Spy/CpxP family protein refolding chaperone
MARRVTIRFRPMHLPLVAFAATAGVASSGAAHAASPSPYAGETPRAVKALSAAELDDLAAGRGMGLALAAELNGHPGPMHARELSAELGLTPDQVRRLAAIEAAMRVVAKRLGAEIVEAERALDAGFAERRLDAAGVERLTAEIGRLAGHLRGVHLSAHIETAAVLTPHQIHRYDVLRGYADGPAGPAVPDGGPQSGGHEHHHPQ